MTTGQAQYSAAPSSANDAAGAKRSSLLHRLGRVVRERRIRRGLTLRNLAERARVSLRFLTQIEAGSGNISVARLAEVAEALDTPLAELLRETELPREPKAIVALLGLRGAGKTTLGKRVAKRLKVPFVELDQLIAREAGMSLATIFEMHGEAYFRRMEHAALRKFIDRGGSAVLATGGSLVMHPEAYDLLKARAITVWLKAEARDHWDRVVAQGDGRPMKDRPRAMNELRALLRERTPLYSQATLVVDTSSVTLAEATNSIVLQIDGDER
jgi:XRE family aerobic/anaerobic benzoate catabolism transcriptional regulator